MNELAKGVASGLGRFVNVVGRDCRLRRIPGRVYNYGLTKTRNTYDVTLPDGRAIKIISPTEVGSARLAENERKIRRR